MFDTNFQTAMQNVYDKGVAAGKKLLADGASVCYNAAFQAGFDQGVQAEADAWGASAEVEAVYFDKGNTVIKFADGQKEKVTYHPEYGYAYDAEKAIMACILKHVVGNGYIKALREFAGKAPVQASGSVLTHGCCANCPVAISVDEDENLVAEGTAPIDVNADEGMNYTADDVVDCGFVEGWEDVPEEPGYDPMVFDEE